MVTVMTVVTLVTTLLKMDLILCQRLKIFLLPFFDIDIFASGLICFSVLIKGIDSSLYKNFGVTDPLAMKS